jgi:putative transposase
LTKNPDIIGFFDEFSPQSTANTQKLWSLTKPVISKNTTRQRANTFGFYAIKGQSTIDFKEHSRKEDITQFLKQIRTINPYGRIMIILDNFRSHHAKLTTETAGKLNIDLVFLPPYSPDLNPIEYIWKTIKRELSPLFIKTKKQLREQIEKHFKKFSKTKTYAKKWIKKFLKKV